MGSKFKIKFKVEKLELEIEGNREDVPLITQALGQQVSGLLAPASDIVQGEITENYDSQRGAVHISPYYVPNHMDSKFLIESVRWCMNEALRIFWQGDREEVAKTIRELLQFDVPCIGNFEDIILVQRTDLTSEEEVLVLLHYAGEVGFNRNEIGRYAKCSASSVTKAVQKLISPQFRQIILLSNNKYRLSNLGSKRLREELGDKLLLQ